MKLIEFRPAVLDWAGARGILANGTVQGQMLKLVSEWGETCDSLAKDDEDAIKDGIGDCAVVCTILAVMVGGQIAFAPQEDLMQERHIIPRVLHLLSLIARHELRSDSAVLRHLCDLFSLLRLLALQRDLSFSDCCAAAWDEIKDRKGFLNEQGVFVKEES